MCRSFRWTVSTRRFPVPARENRKEIEKLLITASGGPFRGKTRAELENVTVEQALRHPNWSMGHKITIDSATLVNKGLEVMEAKWLFGVDLDHIQVVVQPKSIIHSMVEFKDGAVMAQLGTPDMKLPIQYALYYPERRFLAGDRLDFAALTQITFEEPNMDTFLGLPMAMQASRTGGSMPTVFNAANERAVALFLAKKIRFLEIYGMQALQRLLFRFLWMLRLQPQLFLPLSDPSLRFLHPVSTICEFLTDFIHILPLGNVEYFHISIDFS